MTLPADGPRDDGELDPRPLREDPVMARILIVEDEVRIASFVAKGLRADGHTTVTADTARRGSTTPSAATST